MRSTKNRFPVNISHLLMKLSWINEGPLSSIPLPYSDGLRSACPDLCFMDWITQLMLGSLHHINISWSMVRHLVFTSSKPGATFQVENSYWPRIKPLLQGFVLWFSYMGLSEALYSQHFALSPGYHQ